MGLSPTKKETMAVANSTINPHKIERSHTISAEIVFIVSSFANGIFHCEDVWSVTKAHMSTPFCDVAQIKYLMNLEPRLVSGPEFVCSFFSPTSSAWLAK